MLDRPFAADLRPITGTYAVGVPQALRYLFGDQREVHVPALEERCPTVFRGGESGGRRLTAVAPLLWGRAYYAVCPPGVPFQPPGGITYTRLAGQHPYQGVWFELPDAANATVLKWVEQTFDRTVEHPQVSVTLVSPAGSVGRDDDAILVDAGEEAVVAVVRERGAVMPATLTVLWHDVVESSDVAISPSRETPDVAFVSLGRVRPGRTLLSVGDDDDEVLILEGRQGSASVPFAQPLLAVQDDADLVKPCPVSSIAAAAALAGACDAWRDAPDTGGTSRFVLPRRGWCVVRTQRRGQSAAQEEVVRWPQPAPATPDDPVDPAQDDVRVREALAVVETALSTRLQRAVVTGADRVEFDFGAFGRLVVAPLTRPSTAPQLQPLSAPLRQRIQWCLAAQTAAAATASAPLCHGMQPQVVLGRWSEDAKGRVIPLSAGDRILLERLARTRLWPASLVPHLTTLVDALTRWASPTERTPSGVRTLPEPHRS